MDKKHEYCTTEEFKTDIENLCHSCPIAEVINNDIEARIVKPAEIKKEVLSDDQFNEYINKEVVNASLLMDEAYLFEQENEKWKNDPDRKGRIELFIWNKERIKALNRVRSGVKHDGILKHEKADEGNVPKRELSEFFEVEEEYKAVMDALVGEKKIDADSNVWIDEGNGYKGFVVSFIKHLHVRKYFVHNIRPSNNEIVMVCLNTFGVTISIDTAKKIKSTDFVRDFGFIPNKNEQGLGI